MKLDIDTKQRLTTGVLFLLEFYKVLMGTFLGLFIPLKCKDKLCTVSDNLYTDDRYHQLTNIYNLVAFFFVMGFYYVELRRENWSIEYLDIDESKPINYLDMEIERYPIFKSQLNIKNKQYLNWTRCAIFMLISNFCLSGVLVGFNYYNINTLNSIFSFFILVFIKLAKAHGIAYRSLNEELVCSGYLTTPKVYNCVDVDHRLPESTGNVIEVVATKNDDDTIDV